MALTLRPEAAVGASVPRLTFSLTRSMALLAKARLGRPLTADDLCDHVLTELTPEPSGDDICILAATLSP